VVARVRNNTGIIGKSGRDNGNIRSAGSNTRRFASTTCIVEHGHVSRVLKDEVSEWKPAAVAE